MCAGATLFQAQLSSVLDGLLRAAVREVGQLVQGRVRSLEAQLCRSRRDNEALRARLQLRERELRGCGLHAGARKRLPRTVERVSAPGWGPSPWTSAQRDMPPCPVYIREDGTEQQEYSVFIKEESADTVEQRSKGLQIKQERCEEVADCTRLQRELLIRAVESSARPAAAEGAPTEGAPEPTAREGRQEVAEQRRSRQSLEAVSTAEPGPGVRVLNPPVSHCVADGLCNYNDNTDNDNIHNNEDDILGTTSDTESPGNLDTSDTQGPGLDTVNGLEHFDAALSVPSSGVQDGDPEGGGPSSVWVKEEGETKLEDSEWHQREQYGQDLEMVDEPGWGKSVSGELKEIAEPYSAREDSLPQAACFSKFPASFSSFTTLPELESQNALNSSAYNRCPQCGKGYASAWLLKIHPCTQAVEASVAGGEDFCCSQCGKTFSGWGSLKSHQQIHNSVAAAVAKSHGCARCGKTFQLLSSLETHQQEHSEEEEEEEEVEEEQEQEGSHICHQCGKAFLSLGSLRAHQRSHVNSAGAAAGDRRNSCSQCGKSFSHVRNLKRHQRIHTGERPYCCPYCGKSFNQSNSLKTHLRLHTGERPYSCAQCGKSFIRLVCLRRHQRSHVVERERGERERLHALQGVGLPNDGNTGAFLGGE
ncbi:uncharacterized protein LOC136755421 [Amia ocellicauda]|uniref:uncharacterized protein LOC136755421 n=1 Tax=Amia ocellicauda TaxID=2972642 RepID=UPI003463F632